MKQSGLLHGILVAGVLTVLSVPILVALNLFLPRGAALQSAWTVTVLGYLAILLSRSGRRTGRVVAALFAVGLALFAFLFLGWLKTFVLLAAVVWLVRCLLGYRGLIPAALDLFITVASVGAGIWMLTRTGSFAGMVWGFFLGQALTGLLGDRATGSDYSPSFGFNHAHDCAERALRRLAGQRAI